VLLEVRGENNPKKVLTISYGWRSPDFYEEVLKHVGDAAEFSGAALNPFGSRSEYAEGFLMPFNRSDADRSRFCGTVETALPDVPERVSGDADAGRKSVRGECVSTISLCGKRRNRRRSG